MPGVLAEFGDEKNRFVDAKSRRNCAGTSLITKASGTRRVVVVRYARTSGSRMPRICRPSPP